MCGSLCQIILTKKAKIILTENDILYLELGVYYVLYLMILVSVQVLKFVSGCAKVIS